MPSQIPPLIPDLDLPGLYIAIDRSQLPVALARPRLLLIGLGESGSAINTTSVNTPITVDTIEAVVALAGPGSPLADMARAVWANYPGVDLQIAAPSLTGTAAEGEIEVTSSPAVNGTVSLYVNGTRYPVAVAKSDSLATVASAIEDAINNDDNCPLIAAATSAVVDLEAKYPGKIGNEIKVFLNYQGPAAGEITPDDLALTITPVADGAGDPSLTELIAAIEGEPYTGIVYGFTDLLSIQALRAELVRRWGPGVALRSVLYTAERGDTTAVRTRARAIDDWRTVFVGYESSNITAPWTVSAAVAGLLEYRAALGPHRPCDGLPVSGVLPTPIAGRFRKNQQSLAVADGVSVLAYSTAGHALIGVETSTQRKNPIQVAWLLRAIANEIETVIPAKYPQMSLVSDAIEEVPAGCVAPRTFYVEFLALGQVFADRGWLRDLESWDNGLVVEENATDPDRVDVLITPRVAGQLRKIAVIMQPRR